VIESPNATTVAASDRRTSRPDTTNHEVVERGKAVSDRSAAWSPAPRSVRYDVVNEAACQVIGRLVPRTYGLTARSRAVRVASLSRIGSLTASLPAATVTKRRRENLSVRLVRGSIVPAMA
jgi:hypothetical protein